jgi:hypothetical protein
MNRKKFFTKFSLAVVGLTFLKSNPVKFFKEKFVSNSNPVKVTENKLAVKREKAGVKNV